MISVNDDRTIDVVLPISGDTITLNSPKGKHLRAIQKDIRKQPDLTDAEAMVIILNQLVTVGFKLAQFDELDFEDIEELGKALKSFRAFSQLGVTGI